ncbi:hypothetical protein CLOM_g12042 [Closterium sp. NIES-68]|nr:hypothetical protein CLOM_g12042 [Closterium sp. NIES-68]
MENGSSSMPVPTSISMPLTMPTTSIMPMSVSMSMEVLQRAMADEHEHWDAADDPQGTMSMMAMLLAGNDSLLAGNDGLLGGTTEGLLGGTNEGLLGGNNGLLGGNDTFLGGAHGDIMLLGGPQANDLLGGTLDNGSCAARTEFGGGFAAMGAGNQAGASFEAAYKGTEFVEYDNFCFEAPQNAATTGGGMICGAPDKSQGHHPSHHASVSAHGSLMPHYDTASASAHDTDFLTFDHGRSSIAPPLSHLWVDQQQQQQQQQHHHQQQHQQQQHQQQHLLLQPEPQAQAWPDLKTPADLKPERRALVVQPCDYKGGKGAGYQGARLLQMPPGLRLPPPVAAPAPGATTASAGATTAAAGATNAACATNAEADSGVAAPAPAAPNAHAAAQQSPPNVHMSVHVLPRASTAPANTAPLRRAAAAAEAMEGESFPADAGAAAGCSMLRSHSSSSTCRPLAVWLGEGAWEGAREGMKGVGEGDEGSAAPGFLLQGPGELQGIDAGVSPAAAVDVAGGGGGAAAMAAGLRKSRSSSSSFKARVVRTKGRGGGKRGGGGMSRSRSSHGLRAAAAAAAAPASDSAAAPGEPESDLPAFLRENQALAQALLNADLCFSPNSGTAAAADPASAGTAACSYDVSAGMSGAAGGGMSSCSLGGTATGGETSLGGTSMGGTATGGDSSDPEEPGLAKGTWLPEEDRVLMQYVGSYGPRNWGALRARGLLRRSGKSCRLRWVNQLKPGLQRYAGKGCKRFTEAEANVVLSLQRVMGNKWAQISRHLPGARTTSQEFLEPALRAGQAQRREGGLTGNGG